MFILIQCRARSIHLRRFRTYHALSKITFTQRTTKHGNVCFALKRWKARWGNNVQNVKLIMAQRTASYFTVDTGSNNNNNKERFLCFE